MTTGLEADRREPQGSPPEAAPRFDLATHYNFPRGVEALCQDTLERGYLELVSELQEEPRPWMIRGAVLDWWLDHCCRFRAPYLILLVHPATQAVTLWWLCMWCDEPSHLLPTLQRAVGERCVIETSPAQLMVQGLTLSEARLVAGLIPDMWELTFY